MVKNIKANFFTGFDDYREGFLKGMEDIYTLVWQKNKKSFELPSLGNWDYEILTNMYSVGYYKGYVFFQEILLKKEENYICLTEVIDQAIKDSYIESCGYTLKKLLK